MPSLGCACLQAKDSNGETPIIVAMKYKHAMHASHDARIPQHLLHIVYLTATLTTAPKHSLWRALHNNRHHLQ